MKLSFSLYCLYNITVDHKKKGSKIVYSESLNRPGRQTTKSSTDGDRAVSIDLCVRRGGILHKCIASVLNSTMNSEFIIIT